MKRGGSLAHRHLLGQQPGYQPFAGTGLFARVGGQPTVDRLVDLLYDGFEADPALRPLFGRDLTGGRANQKVFFAQWLGGGHRYAERSYSGTPRPRHPTFLGWSDRMVNGVPRNGQ
jgi:hypothetical protein